MADENTTELRFKAPRLIVDVIDAVSIAQRKDRTELINEILSAWADDRMREATAIMRVAAGGANGGDR